MVGCKIVSAAAVAQLVEVEVRGLNPVISKLLYRTFVHCQLC